MKQFYIALMLCATITNTTAQNNVTMQATEVVPDWPFMLSNLNTSQITSVVLIDKITTFANVINLNM